MPTLHLTVEEIEHLLENEDVAALARRANIPYATLYNYSGKRCDVASMKHSMVEAISRAVLDNKPDPKVFQRVPKVKRRRKKVGE